MPPPCTCTCTLLHDISIIPPLPPFDIHHQILFHHYIMASFATRYFRTISSCSHLGGITKRGFVSSTIPKYAAATTKTEMKAKLKSRADLFPIYILLGFTGGAVFLAVRSVTMQLFHHPGVQVNKTNRSMMPEVDCPDSSLASGDKFISKSVLRKVAHIQKRDDTVSTDGTENIYKTRSRDSTNLKTVGVDPRANRG